MQNVAAFKSHNFFRLKRYNHKTYKFETIPSKYRQVFPFSNQDNINQNKLSHKTMYNQNILYYLEEKKAKGKNNVNIVISFAFLFMLYQAKMKLIILSFIKQSIKVASYTSSDYLGIHFVK